ncbi:hypothetical protein [Allorhizocola rhizosphaerae]|uniref:hypothetical protein n=1 Tax=Allorhizocola rhizosphaerae TaxID=1872709 RepID=UPI000E3B81B8|nr:hypothetical protein [Allorhizocola rhizosphaerae]
MAGRLVSWLPVRPRTAVALALLFIVALVVAIGRLVGGEPEPMVPQGQTPVSTVDPSTGNDSVVDLQPSPTPKQAATGPEVVGAATVFAQNWIDHERSAQAWRDALVPLCTKALAAELSGVDPASVPADRITGVATTEVHADASVDVIFPIDVGKLRLRMVLTSGRWLVDGIDWERQ